MKLNTENWPYRWFGYWSEYGLDFRNYPSIKDFINSSINSEYDKKKIANYFGKGIEIAATSKLNFPSPITGELRTGVMKFKTDGIWLWLDDIENLIESEHLIMPKNLYNQILNNEFDKFDFDENLIDNLDWPNL